MAAIIIDGRQHANTLISDLHKKINNIKNHLDITPKMTAILIGDDPASQIYVKLKQRRSEELGITCEIINYPNNITQQALIDQIQILNHDPLTHGILVQLPPPKHIPFAILQNTISPHKDVDGITYTNIGALNSIDDHNSLEPCTPQGVMHLILASKGLTMRDYKGLSGLQATVLGRSMIVGKPMSSMLLRANCSVTILHSHTPPETARAISANSDILVVAIGRPKAIGAQHIKPGACVIDVGIHKDANTQQICGDIDLNPEVLELAGSITPTPGGVGPMTVAYLMKNVIQACCIQNKRLDLL